MSVKTISKVWKCSAVTGAELLILLALADSSDDDGLSCPDMVDVSHKARLSIEDTRAVLKKLVCSGRLQLFKNVGAQGNDFYKILMPEVQANVD